MIEGLVETVQGRLYVPYRNWLGKTASLFFRELRDRGRLMATRCRKCERVYMPPRSICPECFMEMDQWVELPATGTLLTYTVVHYSYSDYHQPRKAPYALGIVRLDGADTGLCHLLGEVDFGKLRVGMRVEAVLKEERKGNILDIAYFRPLREGSESTNSSDSLSPEPRAGDSRRG
jgi:hypothetical protein